MIRAPRVATLTLATGLLAWCFLSWGPGPEGPHPSANTEPPAVLESAHAQARPASERDYFRQLEDLQREDLARALAWARMGNEWYGSEGEGAEAREAAVVTSLVDLGRMEEARGQARIFIERHPASRYRPLVQGVTGIHPRPTGPREAVHPYPHS